MDTHKQHTIQDHSTHKREDHPAHNTHQGHTMSASKPMTQEDHSAHNAHQGHAMPAMSKEDHSAHAGHDTDHSGHEQMFRVRFWWSLLLSIPVLAYSEMIQMWLGSMPSMFPFSKWIPFVFSLVIFAYGGIPFLNMAVPELRERRPGMMTLISLAISATIVRHPSQSPKRKEHSLHLGILPAL